MTGGDRGSSNLVGTSNLHRQTLHVQGNAARRMRGWGWPRVAGLQRHPPLFALRRKGLLTGLNFRAQRASLHAAEMPYVSSNAVARPQAQSATDTGASWLLCLGATANSPQITFAQIDGTLEVSKVRETVVKQYWFFSLEKGLPLLSIL